MNLDLGSLGVGDVTLKRSGDLATVTLSNPEVHNAISGRMMSRLAAVVEELESFDGSVVVVRGAGHSFCSGADLRVVGKSLDSREAGEHMSRHMQEVLERLRSLPLVSVALVEGVAYGGGAELLTACDHRLVSKEARIRFIHAKMGVSVGWGGGARLVELVGREFAIRCLTTAAIIPTDTALLKGLATELFVPERSDEALSAFIEPILKLPSASVRANKLALCPPIGATHTQVMSHERSIFTDRWVSKERSTAMRRYK